MSLIRGVLKTASSLIGATLMLAGVGAFFWGVVIALKGNYGRSALLIVGGIAVSAVANYLGKFARGDFD